jgi:hypothetical protein
LLIKELSEPTAQLLSLHLSRLLLLTFHTGSVTPPLANTVEWQRRWRQLSYTKDKAKHPDDDFLPSANTNTYTYKRHLQSLREMK